MDGIWAAVVTGLCTVIAQLIISTRAQRQSKEQHEQTIAQVQHQQDKALALIENRLESLEEKQDKHNRLIERMAVVEQSVKSAHHRIDELRKDGE